MTLVWIQKKLASPRTAKSLAVKPSGTWQEGASMFGSQLWQWRGAAGGPKQLQLAEAAPAGAVATLRYESSVTEVHALPVQVTATKLNGSACPDSATPSGLLYAGNEFCVQSSVTYQTMPLFPIPGVLTGRMTLTRTAEMRIMQ